MSFDLLLTQREVDTLTNENINLSVVYGIPGISGQFGVEIANFDDYEAAMKALDRSHEL